MIQNMCKQLKLEPMKLLITNSKWFLMKIRNFESLFILFQLILSNFILIEISFFQN